MTSSLRVINALPLRRDGRLPSRNRRSLTVPTWRRAVEVIDRPSPQSSGPSRVASHLLTGDRARSVKMGKTDQVIAPTCVKNVIHAIYHLGTHGLNEHSFLVPGGTPSSLLHFCNHSCLHYKITAKWIKVSSERGKSCSSLHPCGSRSGKVVLDIKTASKEACLFSPWLVIVDSFYGLTFFKVSSEPQAVRKQAFQGRDDGKW